MTKIEEIFETAILKQQAGDIDQAQCLCAEILQAQPQNPAALHLTGVIAYQKAQYELAVDLISKAIESKPEPLFYNTLGIVFETIGKPEPAFGAYQQAAKLFPDNAEAWYNMAMVLKSKRMYSLSAEYCQRAISIKADYPEACNLLGYALQMQGLYTEAIDNYTRAIALKPDYAGAYNMRASALQMEARYSEAIADYEHALSIKPDSARVHMNLGMLYLLKGDFVKGWREYSWRLKLNNSLSFQIPKWNGQPFVGKNLFLYTEQGLGDAIQFARYLPMVKQLGGRIIFAAPKPLHGLLSAVTQIDELVETAPNTHFDLYLPILSLPEIFNTDLGTIPAQVPYLYADQAKAEYYKTRINDDRFKIGIVWAGGKSHINDHNRSCPLELFRPLTLVPQCKIYALQKGPLSSQTKQLLSEMNIENLGDCLEDFTDTAAAIENMDLIISVDTATLHLAGAMAKPTWALLPFNPDWRWLLERNDSPWYPTMKILRQQKPNDWKSVFDSVISHLPSLINKPIENMI
jgi:Flp pilus assembly protein TadD